jgi:hypothetical protein
MDDAQLTLDAKEALLNTLYAAPELAATRSTLTRAGAALCACDGALCRMIGNGQMDRARDMGINVLPLVRKTANLRLRMRRGEGREILGESESLSRDILALLDQIRSIR